MKKLLLTTTLGFALATGAAYADTVPAAAEPVIARLEAEGFTLLDTRRSWLGRLVVLSQRDGWVREVVLNRASGAVLSDRLFQSGASPSGQGGTPDDGGQNQNGEGNSGGNGSPHN